MRNGYRQTQIGTLPSDWRIKRLAEVATIRTGIAKNTNIALTDPIAVHYLRVANVQDGYLDLTEMSKIPLRRGDLHRYSVLPGDVLMNEGGDLDKLGRGAIWRGQFNPCVHQNHVFVVRCESGLDPEFLNTWTSATPARRYFLVAGKQTTNLASINKTALGQLPVPLPPLPEQRAIAEALGDVDALIDSLDQLIAKKRDLKQGAMQQLLTGKTRLPGFSGKWTTSGVTELGDVLAGKALNANGPGSLRPYLRTANVRDGSILLHDVLSMPMTDAEFAQFQILPGDVLLNEGQSLPLVGRCSLYRGEHPTPCAMQNQLLRFRAHGHVDSEFAAHMFRWCQHNGTFSRIATQTTSVAHLGSVRFSKLHLRWPSTLEEQEAIASILADLDHEVAALEQRRDKTRLLKQGMMQELLTGKTRLV